MDTLTGGAGARRISRFDELYREAQSDLDASANLYIPKELVREGMVIAVEIDPDSTLELGRLDIPKRIPESGYRSLGVRVVPVLDLTLVPIVYEGGWYVFYNDDNQRDSTWIDADSTVLIVDSLVAGGATHRLMRGIRTLMPTKEIAIVRGDVLRVRFHDWWGRRNDGLSRYILDAIRIRRLRSNGGGYWMGVAPHFESLIGGRAYLGGWSSVSIAYEWTMAHELGHSLGLGHTWDDSRYWRGEWDYGLDFESMRLIPPWVPDVMSYSWSDDDPANWIGTAFWNEALYHRLAVEGRGSMAVKLDGGEEIACAHASDASGSQKHWAGGRRAPGGSEADTHDHINQFVATDAADAVHDAELARKVR